MKRIFKAAGIVLALVTLALVLGTLVPRPLWRQAEREPAAAHRILVLSNPIHTDIAIPLDAAVLEQFGFVGEAGLPIGAPGARYLIIGWGGRDFYLETPTWSELKLQPLLKGITLDRSVMHVEVAGDIPDLHPDVVGYDLGSAEYEAMLAYIGASFTSGPDGRPMAIAGAHYGDYDGFFEANGRFTALLGCNSWAAGALRAGGLRTGWWNPLPVLLQQSLRIYN